MLRSRLAAGFASSAPLVLAVAPAAAQLTPTTGAVTHLYGDTELFTEFPGGAFAAGSSTAAGVTTLRLTGDGSLAIQPDGSASMDIVAGGWQQFESSFWPMQITPRISANFKVVNAGGPDGPVGVETYVIAQLIGYETGGFDVNQMNTDALGDFMFNRRLEAKLDGNGYLVFDGSATLDPYVLMPNGAFTLHWNFSVLCVTTHLQEHHPDAVTVLEAGGLSGYSGLEITLNQMAVPSPGTALVGAVLPVALLRRRR